MSQPVLDITDFEHDMHGWQFLFWMPPERRASASLVTGEGFKSRGCLRIQADGRDDDGIFFIQLNLKADLEGLWRNAAVSWWLKGEGILEITAWPRVVYLGRPKNLARCETQNEFYWFKGQDGMTTCPDCDGWYRHAYKMFFPEGLEELQICIGWKVNWQAMRTLYLDQLTLSAS